MSTAVKRRVVLAWGLWDWGSASWNAVITSFVFGPYIVRGVVGDARPGGLTANTWLGISTAAAGLLIALIAPVTGQRSDAGGHRKRSLAIWTGLVVATMLALFTVKNEPSYLWIALVLLAAGAVFQEFAGVSYNAMLPQVSTPATVGRVSGLGWSMGYFGGIVLLLVGYVGFIAPDVGWFGVTSEGGLNIRVVAVFSAAWFAIFAFPVLVRRAGEAARAAAPSGQLLRLLPAAAGGREEPVPPRPQLGEVPDRLGALPRRVDRGVRLRRHLGGQRLRHGRRTRC